MRQFIDTHFALWHIMQTIEVRGKEGKLKEMQNKIADELFQEQTF